MTSPIASLIASGTKLWLDSIDPQLVQANRAMGVTGATSNPIIISKLIKTGRFDEQIRQLSDQLGDITAVAWQMTDRLVSEAEQVFLPVWKATEGDDGYVSFELDPLLEDIEIGPPHDERVSKYIESGRQWAEGHPNRMIKVPATAAGIEALEEMVASGITVNVTLIFTQQQYQQAREAVWRGAQRRDTLAAFKSVYSIFISRIDVYTEKHVVDLSSAAQGQVGIVNAKRLWAENQQFWRAKGIRLSQEIIFASTGTKKPEDPPWKYAQALAGADIQTNPPATNDAIAGSTITFDRQVDRLPPAAVLAEIDDKVDFSHLQRTLMAEGLAKFSQPQKDLLALLQ